MPNYKLLLVDDSVNVLKAIQRTLKDEGYEILTAESAVTALKTLEKHSVDIIISDQNMPNISGTDLLKLVKIKYPDVVRMMLTGLTDFKIVKEAINKGEIYKFFNKPYDDFELILAIRYALKEKELKIENQHLKLALKEKNEQLVILENKYPGITEKHTNSDGVFVLDEGD